MTNPAYLITIDVLDLNSTEITQDGPRHVASLRARTDDETLWIDLTNLADKLQAAVTDDLAQWERDHEPIDPQDQADNDYKAMRENQDVETE